MLSDNRGVKNSSIGGADFAGFTLVEVLVGMAILVMVVAMLCQMLNHVSRIWLLGHAQVERSEGGRAALEFITRELEAAQLPANRTDQKSLQLLVDPVSPNTVSETYLNKDAIFWQAPWASDQTYGDLAEVGYFVQWDETTKPANPSGRLCRLFVNPTNNPSGSNYLIYSSGATGGGWVTDSIIAAVAPANNSNTQNPYQGLFVENVLALWVQCLDPEGNQITRDANGTSFSEDQFDSRRGYTYTSVTGTTVVLPGCALPAAIDLSFVILDDNTANRITPVIEKEIKNLAGNAGDANAFVTSARTDATLKPIFSALRPCTTRVYLQNSK
jgi:hypothetical protein